MRSQFSIIRSRSTNFLFVSIVLATILELRPTAAPALVPAHDPADQLFRVAPMAQSARTVVATLSSNLFLAFDMELLRTHTVWRGQSLNLFGPPYSRTKEPFLCSYSGQTLWTMPPEFPWTSGELAEPKTKRPEGGRFRAIETIGNEPSFSYEWPVGREVVRVREILRADKATGADWIVRRLEISACREPLEFLAHAELGRPRQMAPNAFLIDRGDLGFLVVVSRGEQLAWRLAEREADDEIRLLTEKETPDGFRKERVKGHETRAYLKIPAHSSPIEIELSTAVGSKESAGALLAARVRSSPPTPVVQQPARSAAPAVFSGDSKMRWPAAGDAFYRVEHFPAPKELDFLVGGMDWLPDGNLAVCTWLGEVYIVEGAQGPVAGARYRRFARGLCEPLGLTVHDGKIYVAQKTGLTRLTDTDGDGQADLYENINDSWGFTGNYHAYSFGPAIGANGNMFMFITGQRGRWEIPFVGWCLEISRDGIAAPFCSGLRVPNGWEIFGPDHDLFVTDNQGNWVGACKLNHLKRGKFYAFPSGQPAPRDNFGKLIPFEPPALWFPRSLAPSASGITTIRDDRFGPFQGQMLIGDFQNAIVMRVALEKVKGEWQGVVWPFSKGFLSAVNRVAYGPDSKLYVGGCKRTWSAAGLLEYCLDRVSFTGKIPFEVKEAHARKDGLQLIFTAPVDVAAASDPQNFAVSQFTYRYSAEYGSPEIDQSGKENSATEIAISGIELSPDHRELTLRLDGWKTGFVTAVRMLDLKSEAGQPLWHDRFYYTLNAWPE